MDERMNELNSRVVRGVEEVDNGMSSYKNWMKEIVGCGEMLNEGKEGFKV